MVRGEKQITSGNTTAILIGSKLRQAREEQRISLTEMAERLGYSKSYLSGIENGKEKASDVLIRRYERELGFKPGELSEVLRTLRTEKLTYISIVVLLTKSAPSWLIALRDTLFESGKETVIKQSTEDVQFFFHVDEKGQLRHVELALKNAAERGFAEFQTDEEREQYSDVLSVLSETSSYGNELRHKALGLFTLSDTPDFSDLNNLYKGSRKIRPLTHSTTNDEINIVPYLNSFFNALIKELYSDPFFKEQWSDTFKIRNTIHLRSSLGETLALLQQIGDLISDDYTAENFSSDVETYLNYVETVFRYLKVVGIVPKDKNIDPEINSLFVPLHIALDEQISGEGYHSIIEILEQYPYLVLLGAPGSGKSTLLRQLAWSHSIVHQSNFSLTTDFVLSGKPLPLNIGLRRLTEVRKQHREYDFFSYTREVLLGRDGIDVNPQMFKELLERGSMLLLFDGLDEVATLDERQRIVDEIEHIAQTYPGNHILVTSRPIGYDLARFSSRWFAHAQIQEFDNRQIHTFLEQWYNHVLRLSPLPANEQEELEILYRTLVENSYLHELSTNPLLLTIIAALHRYERLPDKRVLIYDRCADLLLETWAKLRGTDARWHDLILGKEDQYACIAHLGFILHEREQKFFDDTLNTMREDDLAAEDFVNDVPLRFILREIERFLTSQKLFQSVAEGRNEAKRFLDLIQIEAGLIVERGTDENGEPLYGFVHRIFQEYFAASNIYERFQQEADLTIIIDFLQDHLFDPHWNEVVFLLFGKLKRKPATTLLRYIFEGRIKSEYNQDTPNESQQKLFFICEYLTEGIAIENELAEVILFHLEKLVRSPQMPWEREKALVYLGKLTQTQSYANLGKRELMKLLIEDNILDIDTKIKVAQILSLESNLGSKEQQQAFKILTNLAQRSGLSKEQANQIAETLLQIDVNVPE